MTIYTTEHAGDNFSSSDSQSHAVQVRFALPVLLFRIGWKTYNVSNFSTRLKARVWSMADAVLAVSPLTDYQTVTDGSIYYYAPFSTPVLLQANVDYKLGMGFSEPVSHAWASTTNQGIVYPHSHGDMVTAGSFRSNTAGVDSVPAISWIGEHAFAIDVQPVPSGARTIVG